MIGFDQVVVKTTQASEQDDQDSYDSDSQSYVFDNVEEKFFHLSILACFFLFFKTSVMVQ